MLLLMLSLAAEASSTVLSWNREPVSSRRCGSKVEVGWAGIRKTLPRITGLRIHIRRGSECDAW